MTATDSAIRVEGLRKAYGTVVAIDGVDLDVHPGEVFALLGPNGAGKTTTIEILEGYRRRDSGDVRVLGVDPAHATAAWRARIGVVLQSSTEADQLTVDELIKHFALYYPNPRDPAEVRDLVGLTDKAGTRVHKLSGGQRRRLDVALGILGRPDLIFLDEPTTGFDPKARRQFWELVRMLAAEGATIVLTTHYLDEAEALADRVAVITHGQIVAIDAPGELGGRASGSATVRWTEAGIERAEETARPTELIGELASRFGGEVPNLSVHRPTLEDVYLGLIGRDEAVGAAEADLEYDGSMTS